jgi:hypothetical protein
MVTPSDHRNKQWFCLDLFKQQRIYKQGGVVLKLQELAASAIR